MARIPLKYGTQTLSIESQAKVLFSKPLQVLPTAEDEIRLALTHPINSPSLAEIIRHGEKIVIVTSDITRYTGSEIYLPILIEELNRCGIVDNNIEIIIALGIHRKQTTDEHRKILGSLYGRIAVYDHECDDPEQLVDHGQTSSGLPVQINPVHQSILEAAKTIKPDLLLNTVLTTEKKIAKVFCGDLEQAHLAGCELAHRLYTAPLQQAVDLAIVSCGGEPKDINFIQAHKALDYGVQAVRPGGTIILLAACPDGFGNATFFDWFNYEELDVFEKALRLRYEINGQTAWSTLSKARNWRVIMISEFNREQTEKMGMEKANHLDEALQMAYKQLPDNPEVVIIPDGGTILPVIDPQQVR